MTVLGLTAQDKKADVAKAKKLELPISGLMRRGAFAYETGEVDAELGALADAAKAAAERAGAAINGALSFIEASNRRFASVDATAAKSQRSKAASWLSPTRSGAR